MATVQKATLVAQVSKKAKARAQRAARARGVSMSLIVEEALEALDGDVAREQKPLVPSKKLWKILREAEENMNNPDYWSPAFTSAQDAMTYLRKAAGRK